MPFPKENVVWSCPDAIAKTLAEYGLLAIEVVIGLLKEANGHKDDSVETDIELSAGEVAARVRELAREREA